MSKQNGLKEFWEKVEKTKNCWIRHGAISGGGYNVLSWDKKLKYAHRVSWMIHFGKIPKGKFVCHKCDVPNCVRPDHLFLGTQQDNLRDMIKKGRRGYTGLPGEKHPSSKLTGKEVLKIREIYKKGKITQQEIARKFGVTQRTISKAISGFTWKCLDGTF